MYVCIYIYICICTYTRINRYTYIYICVYIYTYIYIRIYIYIYVYIHTYNYIHIIRIYLTLYIYIYINHIIPYHTIHTYMHTYIHIYIWMYIICIRFRARFGEPPKTFFCTKIILRWKLVAQNDLKQQGFRVCWLALGGMTFSEERFSFYINTWCSCQKGRLRKTFLRP